MAQVIAIEDGSEIFIDPRGDGRALRVNWHAEDDLVVLSIWRQGHCVATARMKAEDVPSLIQVLVQGLAHPAAAPVSPTLSATS
jgi:hypothetical protein